MLDMPVDVDQFSAPPFAQDKRLHVTFYTKAVQNRSRSQTEGRVVYEEKDYIRIMVPGDRNYELDVPAEPHYQGRFPTQWERYKKGQQERVDGTPLEAWPALNVAQVAELRAMNVFTVDQLANVPDSLAQKMMGNFALRQKAKDFLDAARDSAGATKLAAELAERDVQIAAMQAQLASLTKAMATPPKPAPTPK
jgi:hypothetical protein